VREAALAVLAAVAEVALITIVIVGPRRKLKR
jgi:hypothetical protein